MSSSAPFDIGTLIEATPGVYGGRPCLAGTRFPVLQVAVHYREGMTPEDIAATYEGLDLLRVNAAIVYYLANREAIDADILDEQTLHDRLAAEQRASWSTARSA